MKNYKVYLASPWFNNTQAEREERVKNKLRELGFNVWSPKENSNLSPIESQELREKIFSDNLREMDNCDIIFVITDEKDMGTIWEAGYVYGTRKTLKNQEPIIVYYCETLGDGMFNLMLAQSGDIVITNFKDLDILPRLIQTGEKLAYDGIIE